VKTIVSFTVSQGLLDTTRRLAQAPIFEEGGQNVVAFLRDYHRGMDWRGDRYLGAGANSGWFAKAVVDGWQEPRVMANGVVIANKFGLLSWKVTGGTIVPKRAKMLTIPLVAVAKGVAARQYPEPLFRAGNALCVKLGNKVKAVYALKRSVTQKPWPGAMPPNDQLQAKFMEGANKAIARAIGSS
jgi:hypothetical protein